MCQQRTCTDSRSKAFGQLKMFTRLTVNSFKNFIRFYRYFGLLPFKLNSVGGLEIDHGVTSKVLFFVSYILQVLTAISFIYSLLTGLDEKNNIPGTAIDVVVTLLMMQFLQGSTFVMFKKAEFQKFTRDLLETDRKLDEKYLKHLDRPKNDGIQYVIAYYTYVTIWMPIPFVAMFALKPTHPRYLYRLIPVEYQSIWTFSAYLVIEYCKYISLVSSNIYLFDIEMMFASFATFWLKTVSRDGFKERLQFQDERKEGAIAMEIYEVIEILTKNFNALLQQFIWPMIFASISFLHSYGMYGSLKLYGALHPVVFLMFPLIVACVGSAEYIMCRFLGNVFYYSDNILIRWKNKASKEDGFEERQLGMLERKVIRSKRPLGIKVGSYFIIKRSTWLVLIVIVSNLTINFMLMH